KVSTLAVKEAGAGKRIREYQGRGETVLALGDSRLLRYADIGVGLLAPSSSWPADAHMITRDPLDTFWRLLSGVEQARLMANQSVQMAKIDAFTGLMLSLEPMNRQVMGRIRLAADLASFTALANGCRLARYNTGLPAELLDDPTPWHAMDPDLVIQRLKHKRERQPALPSQGEGGPSLLKFWLDEMRNPFTPALMAGTGLAALTGAPGDGVLISAVVGINGLVGGLQRRKTDRQLRSLGMRSDTTLPVDRDGEPHTLAPEELQPGDEIHLSAGDLVPADARILSAATLEVDESSLTGESLPVSKSPEPCQSANLAERHSMLYEGTTLVEGQAHAVVVAAKALSESSRADYMTPSRASGVEARLDRLTRMTLPLAAFSGLTLLLSGLSRQRPVQEVISSGVSLAVAAVPEGLPILATLSQLAAAGRLSEQGALARNPRAVEALGRMTVLCADKTGTLTEGRLALRYVTVAGEQQRVEALDERAGEILLISALASPETQGEETLAHATDQALNEAVRQHESDITRAASSWTREKEMPFSTRRVYHATLVQQGKRRRICIKGAPDEVLERCNRWQQEDGTVTRMDAAQRDDFKARFHDMAQQGLRILAVAERPARSLKLDDEKVARLIFRGFVALADPVRAASKESVDRLRSAGIQTKMITGDHPETAAAIGRDLGLDDEAGVLTGDQIDGMSNDELAESARVTAIFARVTPAQKARLVQALQDAGEVVGMTGDGANDAAAIRLADVGIALGRESSEAAQQAADLLVVDPRIETIVNAVQEGRALWNSIRDAVSLLVGGNMGEIGFNLLAGIFEGGSPLNPRQLLLMNLLTDTFPALAVALRKPKRPDAQSLMAQGPESALGESLTREIQWRAGLTTSMATGSWALSRLIQGPERAATVGMLTVIGGQLAQTIVAGEASRDAVVTSAASMAALALVVQTPGLARMFGCSRPGLVGWSLVCGSLTLSYIGSRYLPFVEKTSRQWEQELIERVGRWITEDDHQ
ncbi:MAG: cation-transporting P-type ATPase, partial [Oleiphilaceae bacterium]|nr:cation-transporting P-type ATPase [Oleiphilaceae bacterium]